EEVVLALQLADLGGYQAQDYLFPTRYEAEWLEAAGAIGVVLQQEAIDIERAEDFFGDVVVATLGVPGAASVTAADVSGNSNVRTIEPGGGLVVSTDILVQRLVWVNANGSPGVAPIRGDVVRVVRVVDLDVGHALGR